MNDAPFSLHPPTPNAASPVVFNTSSDAFAVPHNQDNAVASPPAADSPATPVSNTAVPDVKIDIDYQEQESDARNEPLPINIDKLDTHPVSPPATLDLGMLPLGLSAWALSLTPSPSRSASSRVSVSFNR
jgi:hypothetical protein